MKLVYIAGPFRPKQQGNQWEQTHNIRRAEELAFRVWSMGAVAVCPHMNTANFQGALPDSVWLEGDLAILARCDAVLLTNGWRFSEGTKTEVAFAQARGIPVFEHVPGLQIWLQDGRYRPAFELSPLRTGADTTQIVLGHPGDESEGA